jgi:diacylglycerol O-acyltransferase
MSRPRQTAQEAPRPGRRASRPASPAAPAGHPAGDAEFSPLDAIFLYIDRVPYRLYWGGVFVLDRPIELEALRGAVQERWRFFRRCRERPVRPPLDLGWPRWAEDGAFDIRRHVHHATAPPPGGPAQLHALVDRLYATPLDPAHPPWEVRLIDGLADGRAALLWKIHHCMVDGVGGAQVLLRLADPVAGMAPGRGVREPRSAPRGRPLEPFGQVFGALLDPTSIVGSARSVQAAAHLLARAWEDAPTRLPLHRPLSSARRLRWAAFALDDFLALRAAAGCKVNDVLLAVITGALRRCLERRGVPLTGLRVRAAVPVNVRDEGQRLAPGNRIRMVFSGLPVGLADPVARLRAIAAEMRPRLEKPGEGRALETLIGFAGWLPAPITRVASWLSAGTVLFSTLCTNVTGPREVQHLLGRRIVEICPIVPLFSEVGLEFAALSYAGRLTVTVVADPALVPDVEQVPDDLREAEAELRASLGVAAGASLGPRSHV